jgi:two-component system, OmpR family, phosphate regulon response regulator PhoB
VPSRTILLVDDNADQRLLYATLLEMAGHEVVTACSAVEGCRIASAIRPELILMDLCMPDESGAIAARRLRADPVLKATRIAVFSLYMDQHWPEVEALEGISLFEKPSTPSDLVATIDRLLEAPDPA